MHLDGCSDFLAFSCVRLAGRYGEWELLKGMEKSLLTADDNNGR